MRHLFNKIPVLLGESDSPIRCMSIQIPRKQFGVSLFNNQVWLDNREKSLHALQIRPIQAVYRSMFILPFEYLASIFLLNHRKHEQVGIVNRKLNSNMLPLVAHCTAKTDTTFPIKKARNVSWCDFHKRTVHPIAARVKQAAINQTERQGRLSSAT